VKYDGGQPLNHKNVRMFEEDLGKHSLDVLLLFGSGFSILRRSEYKWKPASEISIFGNHEVKALSI
jgi:hypothetical protein